MKKTVIYGMALLALVAAAVATVFVGETVLDNTLDMECPLVVLDSDISDGSTTALFYEWELRDPDGVVRKTEPMTPQNSNSLSVDCSFISDKIGVWECSGNLIEQTLTWNGNSWIASGGVCDSETITENVVEAPVCGDSVVEGAEQCDDGNTESGDGCSISCVTEFCGDAIVNNGEECDGLDLNGQTCSSLGHFGGTLSCQSCSFDEKACLYEQPTEESHLPVDDAKVAYAQPNSNFGLGRYALAYDYRLGTDRYWLEFDLSNSAHSSVSSADLEIFLYHTFYADNIARPVQVWYCDDTSFDETTITWNTQPEDWSKMSGTFLSGSNCALADATISPNTVYVGNPETSQTWNLKDEVNKELSEDGKFSLVVKYPSEYEGKSTRHLSYYLTKDYGELAYEPKLKLS